MAAYRLVDDGLTACTPGSAQGLTLGNEYGKPLQVRLLHYWDQLSKTTCMCHLISARQWSVHYHRKFTQTYASLYESH